jgi:xylulokinase
MQRLILSHDLGTGGNKASLFDADGIRLISVFEPYETFYPGPGMHEQRPVDWWNAIVRSTRRLLESAKERGITSGDVGSLAISGHSLGCVPLDAAGNLLRESTPIWSDSRAGNEATAFFRNIDPNTWYLRTGNGFPAAHYTLFKILWYKNNEPELFSKTAKILGTKDYINYRLTGKQATDYSYASGCGGYDLTGWNYDDELIASAGLSPSLFPKLVPSTEILGPLMPQAAEELGLSPSLLVAAGGVDNSCMALGASCFLPGRSYASLGSSSWVAVSDSKPLLDIRTKPYVFTHVVPGMFASALAIFSSGTTFRWLRDQLCRDIIDRAITENRNVYELMIDEAKSSPPGARGLLHNPSLGGGSSLDPSPSIRGAFLGLDLTHTRSDIIRAVMEGIALNLRLVLDEFRSLSEIRSEMVVVGGGAISDIWRQIYADALQITIKTTNIGQDAAALGAAALAAVGTGLWSDFSKIDSVLKIEDRHTPSEPNVETYNKTLDCFREDIRFLAAR